jgi:hypothetical protein
VVHVRGGETDAEGFALGIVGGVEGEEQGDGVGSAGDGYADAVAGVDVVAVEGEGGGCGHESFYVNGWCVFILWGCSKREERLKPMRR